MRHVGKFRRKMCGRWRIIGGRRKCCPYPKGHEGECRPYAAVKEAARLSELSDLFLQHDSDDVDCASCAAARRAAAQGCEASYSLALRCDWARSILRTLYEAHNAGELTVPGEVEMTRAEP